MQRPPYDCQRCGACCAYAADWPRFTLEDESAIRRIPAHYVDEARGRMRSDGGRCRALKGEIGGSTECAVYELRPDVCRACEPGDDACLMARRRHGLPV
jgi:Fe-S-cluster containining protein